MAAAFLRIGATAVVAPLWEVADSIAAETARDFYAAIDAGTTVGAAVSALRGKFTRVAAKTPATANFGSYLAYQYFGHPNLILPKEQ
jgi:CHAT domain-containing protein